jgi:uncharacterized protein (TIGR02466 family)
MIKLFPIHLYKGTIIPSSEDEINSSNKLSELFKKCDVNYWPGESNKSTGQLNLDLHSLKEFDWLTNSLLPYVRDYWNNGLEYAPMNICLRDSWANIHGYGDTTAEHSHSDGYHGNCHVSAVYYFKKPKDCGHIMFCDPLDYIKRLTPYRNLKGIELLSNEVKAEQYDFILFPSWIRHKVPPHPVKEERISLSFNYIGYDYINK